MDDIIVTGDFTDEMVELKKTLVNQFEIKDLENLKYFLRMEVAKSSTRISDSQRKYVLDLLNECGMLECKPVDTPMETSRRLEMAKIGVPVDKGRYQRLVGRLIYLSHTRPHISFS